MLPSDLGLTDPEGRELCTNFAAAIPSIECQTSFRSGQRESGVGAKGLRGIVRRTRSTDGTLAQRRQAA